MCDTDNHAAKLLEWYDRHARDMPWRVSPADKKAGIRPDPYRVWMSEIMLQQTTVAAVKSFFETFTRLWPTVHDLAKAQDADVMAAWRGWATMPVPEICSNAPVSWSMNTAESSPTPMMD